MPVADVRGSAKVRMPVDGSRAPETDIAIAIGDRGKSETWLILLPGLCACKQSTSAPETELRKHPEQTPAIAAATAELCRPIRPESSSGCR
eukprot:1566719-Rhodomonas_salina.1